MQFSNISISFELFLVKRNSANLVADANVDFEFLMRKRYHSFSLINFYSQTMAFLHSLSLFRLNSCNVI